MMLIMHFTLDYFTVLRWIHTYLSGDPQAAETLGSMQLQLGTLPLLTGKYTNTPYRKCVIPFTHRAS
jgi:hypothetical protein